LDQNPVTAQVMLPTGNWEMYAIPKGGWGTTPPSALMLRMVMVLLGGLVVIPIFISGWLAEERQQHIQTLAAREAELTRLSRRLGMALQASKVGVWENDIVTGDLYWDDRVNAIFGMPQDSGKRHYLDWEAALHPD